MLPDLKVMYLKKLNKLRCRSISPGGVIGNLKCKEFEKKNISLLKGHDKVIYFTCDLHMGQVLSLSNQVVTHSSQNICLQLRIVGSWKLS